MRLRKHWWWLLAVVAFFVLAAYFANFAPHSNGLSQSTEDWGHFGEYVGGVFGIMAFIGVLITIDLQRRQLEQLSKQATVDELLRIARILSENVDAALERPIPMDSITLTAMNNRGLVVSTRTMKNALELAAEVAVPKKGREHDTMFIEKYHGSIKIAMDVATPELDLLANCIRDAFLFGGDSLAIIIAYYKDRYAETVRRMAVFGYELKSTQFWTENLEQPASP